MRQSLRAADRGLLAMILGVSAVALIVDVLTDQRLHPAPRIGVGLLFAMVPAGLWLVLFYRQDRVESEPKHLVATVAVAAGLIAAAISEPLISLAPRPDGSARWLVALLVVGMLREFTKFLAVRLVAVPANEVNERADGIIYGTAAGVGYATAMNVSFILAAGGADPAPGFAWMTVVVLMHGALGGFVGLLVARDQLEAVSLWWLSTGLLLAALINTAFLEARSALAGAVSTPNSTGMLGSWLGVGLALAVATGITVYLIWQMQLEESRA